MKKNKNKNLDNISPKCIICGKPAKKIGFKSRLSKNIFMGWTYEITNKFTLEFEEMKTKVQFKNKFWKIIGYTKIQREVVYFIWKCIYGWKKIDYIECKKCANESMRKIKTGDI